MAKYLIQGNTLKAIATALRWQGLFYDSMTPSQMPSFIQDKLFSQGDYDALISTPGTSSIQFVPTMTSKYKRTSKVYLIEDSTLLNIVNALREKAGFSEYITPMQIPSYIKTKIISQKDINDLIGKTITRIYNSTCETIGAEAFASCSQLSYVEFTKATTVGKSAFKNCTVLDFLSMPEAITIEADAFYNCKSISNITMGVNSIDTYTGVVGSLLYINSNLQTLSLSNCTNIGDYVCYSCYSLSSLFTPNLQTIGNNAFGFCSSLTTLDLPELTSLGDTAFIGCININTVFMPKLSSCGINVFYGVDTITSVTTGGTTIFDWHSYYPNLIYYSNSTATNIANYAFKDCKILQESQIYIPNVISIESYAFQNTNFSELTPEMFPALSGSLGYWAFSDCSNLQKVNLPSVVTLGASTFQNCISLETVLLPAVSSLYGGGDSFNPFGGCTNLKEVNMNGLTTSVPYTLFQGHPTLTSVYVNGVTTIKQSAFKNCPSLTTISIDNVTAIENDAFFGCTALSSIYAPKLIDIGSYAFQNTYFSEINSDMFPTLSGSIYNWTFLDCSLLQKINLPDLIYLGASAFQNCTALKEVYLPAVTTLYDGYNPFGGCINLENINLDSLQTIPNYFFQNFTNLKTISLKNATTIMISAFNGCNALTTISLPQATLIYQNAFTTAANLSNIQIGDTLSANPLKVTISHNAFNGCSNLSIISILHTSLATLNNSNAFAGTKITSSTGKIIVPSSLYTTYQSAAQWSYFSTQFESITF